MIYKIADNITSPLGTTTEENYQSLKSGNSALRRYENFRGIPEPFTASLFSDDKMAEMKSGNDDMTRFESLVVSSVEKALLSAGIDVAQENVVFILSSTKANIELLENGDCSEKEYPGVCAERIARKIGVRTTPITVCNACISGLSAIILAERLLEAGQYDYAIVCGADLQTRFVISGFQAFKAVSADECRPFDIERLGLNLGEAAATMVFARQPASSVKGWAIESGCVKNDAYHISAPSKNGDGAYLALRETCNGRDLSQLAFINAHGTATMFNDQMESVAIERAGLTDVPVNGLKGYFGHTLGAAGIIETIISMRACDDGIILGTRGFEEIGVSGKVRLSPSHQHCDKTSFLKMISGFGGNNASVWATMRDKQPVGGAANNLESGMPHTTYTGMEQTAYTGMGHTVLVDDEQEGVGMPNAGYSLKLLHHVSLSADSAVVDGKELPCGCAGKEMLSYIYKQYVGNYPKFYKMDMLSRLGFIASELLLAAENRQRFVECEDRAIILFNRSSSIHTDKLYLNSIIDENDYFPSPSLFVYTLPNIVAGEIAIRNLYRGETSFYILPRRNDDMMNQVIEASVRTGSTRSVICGWLDYEDERHFSADFFLKQKQG